MSTFREDLKDMLRNPAFKKQYEEEQERLFLCYQIRQERRRRKLSQQDLAKMKMCLTSRAEDYNIPVPAAKAIDKKPIMGR